MSQLTPEERNRLNSFLKNIKKEDSDPKTAKQKANNNILIVDGNNLFIRSFEATTYMNDNGDHTGGIVASLKSLGAAIKQLYPSRCIVVFDGVGGSYKRKQIYPDYKAHRSSKIRLNRAYEEMSDSNSEDENRVQQYLRFIEYLQILPVNILSIDHVEADDVIAYLALDYFKDSPKITIMSTDKDFLQLCSPTINVYSPTKKKTYTVNEVLDEYKIHPNNFVMFRAMDGDPSDNIEGIERAGNKTLVKHFPWLNEEKIHTIDEIVLKATDLRNKYVVCENIVINRSIIERNYALMQLKDTALTTIAQLKCNEILAEAKIPMLDRGSFFKMVREDRLSNNMPNHTFWVDECFGYLNNVVRA